MRYEKFIALCVLAVGCSWSLAASATPATITQVTISSANGSGGYGAVSGGVFDIYSTDTTFTHGAGNLGLNVSPTLPILVGSSMTFGFSSINGFYVTPSPGQSWGLAIALNGDDTEGFGAYATAGVAGFTSFATTQDVLLSTGQGGLAYVANEGTSLGYEVTGFSITQTVGAQTSSTSNSSGSISGTFTISAVSPVSVPEPASAVLLGISLVGLGLVAKQKRLG